MRLLTINEVIRPENRHLRRCPRHGAELDVQHESALGSLHARCPVDGRAWFWSGASWGEFGGCPGC